MGGTCSIKSIKGELCLILVRKATMNLLLLMHCVENILIVNIDHRGIHRSKILAVLKSNILTSLSGDALLSANVLHAHGLLEHLRLVVIVAQCCHCTSRWRIHTVKCAAIDSALEATV